jgi:adenosine deaminase
MGPFRLAERRVQARYPGFAAEAIVSGFWPSHPLAGAVFDACVAAREEGLAGVDLIPMPYEGDVDWHEVGRQAERLTAAGLRITCHAGEMSARYLERALELPGLRRLGHAVHAAASPAIVRRIADAGVAVECCLTSNVVLGAVPSVAEHPIRRLAEAGVRVTLNTDNPVRLATEIGREYALAAQLGLSVPELARITQDAIGAGFTTPQRKAALVDMFLD